MAKELICMTQGAEAEDIADAIMQYLEQRGQKQDDQDQSGNKKD